MSLHKLALIRYKTIDECLQNYYRTWTLDDLITKCSDALYEYEGMRSGVSKRTVQADIQLMRSDKLGYNAPIIVVDKKYYTYEDKKYSIQNSPINKQDLQLLTEVASTLQQFNSFGYIPELADLITKLQDTIYVQKFQMNPVIHYEHNTQLKNLSLVPIIHKAIIQKHTLTITYQSFTALEASEFLFIPYLLKEYRNRWFVLGRMHSSNKEILWTLAMDRIQHLQVEDTTNYIAPPVSFDSTTYFDDIIGVSKSLDQASTKIVIEVKKPDAYYLTTKPLHLSQEIVEEKEASIVFSINVILNFETERELLALGECMKIISPTYLIKKIKKRLKANVNQYE